MNTTIIAVVSTKGGVGKSTVTVQLAGALAARGESVLIIDCDPQCGASRAYGLREPATKGIATVFQEPGQGLSAAVISSSNAGVALLPSHPHLGEIREQLERELGREKILLDALSEERQMKKGEGGLPWRWILIDSPPDLGIFTANALVAADAYLAIVQTEYLSFAEVERTLEFAERVRGRLNSSLRFLGMVPNQFDRRTSMGTRTLKAMRERYGQLVLDTVLPRAAVLAECSEEGRFVVVSAPATQAGKALGMLADEVQRRACS